FDTDAVTLRTGRADGAMDEAGNSIPGEQFPATLVDGPITFKLGGSANGEKNAVSCHGQDLALPAGTWDRVYILASAIGDVPTAVEIDGKPAPFTAQSWTGFVGQWDHRLWPGN